MNYYPYSSPYGTPQNRAQYGVPSYGGYNYTPQPAQPPQMPQNPPQAQMQYDMPIQDIRFVTSEEAKAFIVMPNTTVLLIDKVSGIAQLKSADNMGQSASKHFRFEEVNADGSTLQPQEPAPKIDLSNFVTLEQFNELSMKFDELKRSFGNNQQHVQRQKMEAQK